MSTITTTTTTTTTTISTATTTNTPTTSPSSLYLSIMRTQGEPNFIASHGQSVPTPTNSKYSQLTSRTVRNNSPTPSPAQSNSYIKHSPPSSQIMIPVAVPQQQPQARSGSPKMNFSPPTSRSPKPFSIDTSCGNRVVGEVLEKKLAAVLAAAIIEESLAATNDTDSKPSANPTVSISSDVRSSPYVPSANISQIQTVSAQDATSARFPRSRSILKSPSSSTSNSPKSLRFDMAIERICVFSRLDSPILIQESSRSTVEDTGDIECSSVSAALAALIPPSILEILNGGRWSVGLRTSLPMHPMAAYENVRLDSARLESSKCLVGLVLVRNLSFEKAVTVRLTVDNWRSSTDYKGLYATTCTPNTPDRSGIDRFSFRVDLPELLEQTVDMASLSSSKTFPLQFAIQYTVGGHDYWDNNCGLNYAVDVLFFPSTYGQRPSFAPKKEPAKLDSFMQSLLSSPTSSPPQSRKNSNRNSTVSPKTVQIGFNCDSSPAPTVIKINSSSSSNNSMDSLVAPSNGNRARSVALSKSSGSTLVSNFDDPIQSKRPYNSIFPRASFLCVESEQPSRTDAISIELPFSSSPRYVSSTKRSSSNSGTVVPSVTRSRLYASDDYVGCSPPSSTTVYARA